MGKIFDIDFRRGSLLDSTNGYEATITNTLEFIQHDKGDCIQAVDSTAELEYAGFTGFGDDGDFSVSIALNIPLSTAYSGIFGLTEGVTEHGVRAYTNGPGSRVVSMRIGDGTNLESNNFTYVPNLWFLITITKDNNNIYWYQDNELVATDPHILVNFNISDSLKILDSNFSPAAEPNCKILWVKFWDHMLTEKERSKLYQEFLRATPTNKIIR
jgi:hypothetical protein